ncbi:MAG TPA: FtsK/SpoIIIE domain-containing protein [Blastocatellia bacterium]|nr:FtsK/SpoIIIE domain-containing protein [Blastocatellia bacterium]
MFPQSKMRIAEIEAHIEELNRKVRESQSQAKALQDHGRQNAAQLDGYFQSLLKANSERFKNSLGHRPISSSANWAEPRWASWNPAAAQIENLIRIGDLVERRDGSDLRLPAYLPFIGQHKTVIVRSRGRSVEQGAMLLQSLLIRTALMLPHQARYTLLDPAGNGIAFPMRRYLPQVRENTGDVRRDLDQVIVDIQRIIESYLDASITSFELVPQEIRINERFQFVFAADFPNQYDRRAIEALQSIGNTGPAAGTYLFIHYNQNHELPRDMSMNAFKNAIYIDADDAAALTPLNLRLQADSAPSPELQSQLFQTLSAAKPPERLLDWDSIAGLEESHWWRETSTRIIETPIGARGGGEKLKLWFGVNHDNQPCAHGMLGAMTGSGKSNLYHVLICGLAVRYSPEELRFYLIDGKDGVEFQPYRHLPHAEVVSLRSSPELSRSVLAELIAEKEYRNRIFSQVGAQDLISYREKGEPEGKFPRILLLVDEYQELFEGDKDANASSYLLQLSQQGRSAGIHMLLASQRFGAAGMLNQTAIFGNLHLLMAMQMKTTDIQALTEFGRRGKALIATCDLPGKIVVNDRGGDDNANIPGKAAYLSSSRREELLAALNGKAGALPDSSLPRRVVFNGQAQPSLSDNPYLSRLLRHVRWPSGEDLQAFAREPIETGGLGVIDWFYAEQPRAVWLGQQFNVRGQAMMVFRRRVGENAMIVGGANAARYGMLAAILTSLAANTDPSGTQFIILDRSIQGSQWNGVLQAVCNSLLLPSGYTTQFSQEAAKAELFLNDLSHELNRRQGLGEQTMMSEPSIFVTMTELDGIEAMRRKADAYGGTVDSPLAEILRRLYVEGPSLGIHLILSFSGVRPMANVVEERRGLINFRHRVALQMSEDDSHALTRSRKASQLQMEGPTPVCALYLDLENDKSVRFKPYSSDAAMVAQNESLIDQLRLIGEGLATRRNHR